MTETGWAGWLEPREMPAGAAARSISEILAAGPTAAERAQIRREAAEEEAKRAEVRDVADAMATAAFRAQVNGRTVPGVADVLAGAAGRDALDREEHDRRRAAVRVLREHGLEDVLGVATGFVQDANLGLLSPADDARSRAARADMDRQYAFARSEREAEERRAVVNRSRVQLEERRRAAGLANPARVSARSAVPDDGDYRRYEQACREIGERPVSFR
jgi:hypothetical protein